MALGSTLAWVSSTIDQDFPSSTALVNVHSQQDALDRILKSPWWGTHFPALPTTLTPTTLSTRLAQEHATYQQDLSADAFLTSFAGKELLHRVLSWLIQGGRTNQRPTEMDLAKAIGTVQRQATRLPAEVSALLAILHAV